ncbi:hypothetical protein [Acidocella facilis]|uniref:hypothetical protein n=1 Tax=Acidocella facilis TaxID=525 RepID=UPI00047BD91E|nr:hypothetical protein [Acidocella facilis]
MAKLDPHTPSGPAFMGANFDPEAAMRQFQARTANLLQAQERLFQGLGAAMRAQMRFSQEYLASRMTLMQWNQLDPTHVSDLVQRDIEQAQALAKEISDELRESFTEASTLLRTIPAPRKAAEPTSPEPAREVHETSTSKARTAELATTAPKTQINKPVAASAATPVPQDEEAPAPVAKARPAPRPVSRARSKPSA